jgi:hypothetical protein
MKMGHSTGTKVERKGASDWYKAIEAANIQAVEDAARALTTALATQVGNAVAAMPDAAARISKAASIVQRKDVWPMTDGTFLVGSQTDTEKAYLIRRGPWQCECKHAQHHGSLCAHAIAAMLTVKLGTQYQPSYK